MTEIGVVIAAAGKGRRMGRKINKQFLKLLDRPILYHTINSFLNWERSFELVVVLHSDEIEYFKKKLLPFFESNIDVNLVAGGESRKESVNNGLESFSDNINYVIIHDGARPLVTEELIEQTFNAVKKYKAVSCGVKVKDTIKVVNKNSFSKKTLNRDCLRAIQTPQAFELNLIRNAHLSYKKDKALDDASLVEEYGEEVYIVKGDYNNFKITTPEDLKPAEIILKERN